MYVSNQVSSRPIYSPSGLNATSLHIKNLQHLVNVLTDKADVRIKEKS